MTDETTEAVKTSTVGGLGQSVRLRSQGLTVLALADRVAENTDACLFEHTELVEVFDADDVSQGMQPVCFKPHPVRGYVLTERLVIPAKFKPKFGASTIGTVCAGQFICIDCYRALWKLLAGEDRWHTSQDAKAKARARKEHT